MIGRKMTNHVISNRTPSTRGEREGGSVTRHSKNPVDSRVNLTNGIKGIGTVQGFTPQLKAAPIYQAKSKEMLEDFKNITFGRKKRNIKLKL